VHHPGSQDNERSGRPFRTEAENQLRVYHSGGDCPFYRESIPMGGDFKFVRDVWNQNVDG
jgi:hypothetical protein